MPSIKLKLASVAALSVLLPSCTNMTRSIGLDAEASPGMACRSNVGAYSLPRRLIRVRVSKKTDDGFGINVEEGPLVADRNETYCLDFLLSGYADDRIGIVRDGSLLKRVFTKSTDQSAAITKKLVRAGADLAASNLARLNSNRDALFQDPSLKGQNGEDLLRFFEFDPMREADMRDVNLALRPYGYCLYIDPSNDQFAPDWAERSCKHLKSGPYRASKARSGLEILDDSPVPASKQRGILYRPELTHKLTILRQDDPGVSGAPWYRVGSKRLSLPNAAPAFLLKVKRAMFVTAETDIKFNGGIVQSVEIDKPSELKAATELLVEAVQIVQKIPTQALNIFHNRAGNTKALIDVNQQMIKQLEERNKTLGVETPRNQLSSDATSLILNRSVNSGGFVADRTAPAVSNFFTCLNLPAARQSNNAVARCRDIVNGNL